MPVNNEASERLSRKSSHAYKPREGVEINRASTLHGAGFKLRDIRQSQPLARMNPAVGRRACTGMRLVDLESQVTVPG